MYALLTQNGYKDYKAFSNDGWVRNGRADDYDSLESIHNIIHGITGGDGTYWYSWKYFKQATA